MTCMTQSKPSSNEAYLQHLACLDGQELPVLMVRLYLGIAEMC